MPVSASAERPSDSFRLTVLGTTDLHGNVLNWNYFTDTEYDDAQHNDIGLAKIATLVEAIRAERGWCATLLLDAGDTLQGTPLSYYYARIEPITGPDAPIHPMAAAMNAIGYDAAALGNHEFNYGLPTLRAFQSQLDHPLLGANVLDSQTGAAAFEEFVIREVPVGEHRGHPRGHRHTGQQDYVKVGILGLVTPGSAIWDKAELDGRLTFNGIVEQAMLVVPKLKRAGADVVIVACHSGADPSSSYGDALPWPENASAQLAAQVPDIDAILVGHTHVEIPQRFVTGPDGVRQVLLSQPLRWGERLTVMDLELANRDGRWQVASAGSTVLNTNTARSDHKLVALLAGQHEVVRGYVNGVLGSCPATMSAATARYQHTAALALVNYVQAEAVRAAIAGTAVAGLPVLSIAAPVNPDAVIPAGPVTVRDVAGLYSYDNTLLAVTLTGAELREYLEFSARYFRQLTGSGPWRPDQLTNAVTASSPTGTADYNYDIVGGAGRTEPALSYAIELTEPAGSRIRELSYGGQPVTAEQRFVVAINNYRQAGGGNFPVVTSAPVVYDARLEIRQLIIEWVSAAGTIDPTMFSRPGWRLLAGGRPIQLAEV